MQKGPTTPKGFSDVLPIEAKSRRDFINKVVPVLEEFGFQPLETPTVEFADTLLGKYGDQEKLIYQFEDRGGRKLALRYDLTVPLARFIANNLGLLNPIFSRYQIGQVFRGENPQKGRTRELTQFDFDTVGSTDIKEDVSVIYTALTCAKAAGLTKAIMQINDRELFDRFNLTVPQVMTIDKIEKIGRELVEKDVPNLKDIENAPKSKRLEEIFTGLNKNNLQEGKDYIYNPFLARGLNYYTSTIYELKLNNETNGLSIGGGGRYDNLIGIFAGKTIPAVGFSFGLSRIVDLMSNS
jgi:histidyl-tRNA synthetase